MEGQRLTPQQALRASLLSRNPSQRPTQLPWQPPPSILWAQLTVTVSVMGGALEGWVGVRVLGLAGAAMFVFIAVKSGIESISQGGTPWSKGIK